MGVEFYHGIEGVTVEIHSRYDLAEAMDAIHSQVMENMEDDPLVLAIVSRWLEQALHLPGSMEEQE